jgi:hypothetical protein
MYARQIFLMEDTPLFIFDDEVTPDIDGSHGGVAMWICDDVSFQF